MELITQVNQNFLAAWTDMKRQRARELPSPHLDTCASCAEQKKLAIASCLHSFCEQCIEDMANTNNNLCPICGERSTTIIDVDLNQYYIATAPPADTQTRPEQLEIYEIGLARARQIEQEIDILVAEFVEFLADPPNIKRHTTMQFLAWLRDQNQIYVDKLARFLSITRLQTIPPALFLELEATLSQLQDIYLYDFDKHVAPDGSRTISHWFTFKGDIEYVGIPVIIPGSFTVLNIFRTDIPGKIGMRIVRRHGEQQIGMWFVLLDCKSYQITLISATDHEEVPDDIMITAGYLYVKYNKNVFRMPMTAETPLSYWCHTSYLGIMSASAHGTIMSIKEAAYIWDESTYLTKGLKLIINSRSRRFVAPLPDVGFAIVENCSIVYTHPTIAGKTRIACYRLDRYARTLKYVFTMTSRQPFAANMPLGFGRTFGDFIALNSDGSGSLVLYHTAAE